MTGIYNEVLQLNLAVCLSHPGPHCNWAVILNQFGVLFLCTGCLIEEICFVAQSCLVMGTKTSTCLGKEILFYLIQIFFTV